MKDYSMGADGNFILNYEIKDNMIITNHPVSEGFVKDIINKLLKRKIVKIKCYEYSKEKEIDILKQMKNQLLNKNYIKAEKTYLLACYDDFKRNLLRTLLFFMIIVFSIGTPYIAGILIFTSFYFVLTLKELISYFYTKIKIKIVEEDILKSELFLENELKLNYKIRNQNVLDNSCQKVQELVKNTDLSKPVFTINTIDNISFEDLKDLIENIGKTEELENIENRDKIKRLKNMK